MKRTEAKTDLAPYAAVFLDTAAWAPDLRPSLERDYERLYSIVLTRGVSFCYLDMPEAGRILDYSLSRGSFDQSTLPSSFGRVSMTDQKYFLKSLFEKVFTEEGTLREAVDENAIFFLRQILYLAKKVDVPCPKQAKDDAVDDFIKIEASMRRPTMTWDLDTLECPEHGVSFLDGYMSQPDLVSHRDPIPRPLLIAVETVSDVITSMMPEFDWRTLVPGHGPGAVSDVKTGTDKYLFKFWPRKLGLVFPAEYFAQHREDLHPGGSPLNQNESMAKLTAVPKTYKGPRLITVEPVAHQYIQQGMLRWIRDNFPRPLRYCVNFRNQSLSGEAALLASPDGKSATVDLSSASDRLSCWVVERMFRKNPTFLSALHACRTRAVRIRKDSGNEFVKMRKYAGQGNATTFPVQSMAYSIMAIACLAYEQGMKINNKNVAVLAKQIRVFGDDIIIPSLATRSLVTLLPYLGLKVNVAKSHFEGKFRESCGTDAYNGVDVTPVYVRSFTLGERLSDLVSWVDVCNNAYRSGLWTLSDWMVNQIPVKYRKMIPVSRGQLGCLTLTANQDCPVTLRTRYNINLCRSEMLAMQVTGKAVRKRRGEYEGLLQYFLEAPRPDSSGVLPDWSAGYLVRNRILVRKRWVPSY